MNIVTEMSDKETNNDDTSDTKRLVFDACDVNSSGYIEMEDLEHFSEEYNWTQSDCEEIFQLLDVDNDGFVSYEDFLNSDAGETLLKQRKTQDIEIVRNFERRHSIELRARQCEDCIRKQGNTWPKRVKSSRRRSLSNLTEDQVDKEKPPKYRHSVCVELSPFTPGYCNDLWCNVVHLSLSCQEQVIELYQQIHSEYPRLLAAFERIILDVIRDVRFHQQENERLERSYKREKEQHDRHLRHLEEEMETQMQRTEQRVRKEERARMEQEKQELRLTLEQELAEMQQNVNRLQQIEREVSAKDEQSDESVAQLRDRIEELQSENRYLKSDLTDAQTNLALLRSELAALRQQYEDKQRELLNEKTTLKDYVREQESLSRQLHLLHDANKRLHDTNDDLRAAIEAQRQQDKRTAGATSAKFPDVHQRGSVVGNYFDPIDMRPSYRRIPSVNEELLDPVLSGRNLRALRQRSCDRESLPEDFGPINNWRRLTHVRLPRAPSQDSGNSTLRDLNEFDSECEGVDTWDGDSAYGNSRRSTRAVDPNDTEVNESLDEYETEVESDLRRQISRSSSRSRSPQPQRSPSISSCGSNRSQRHRRRKYGRGYDDKVIPNISGEPERMYKVILAGDCAVGKSSFIMRLCKGKFLQSLNSTLGVDFQTKTIEVDGHVIALQLWDTAGQERFRSIAKSYFRRADGVLLLYDCTYERSFINVREWLEAIEDGAEKKIPIMMVGNKTDLREEMEAQGRRVVKEEDGQRLARTFDGLFIETSAKDGSNIIEAVTELARLLRCNEDVEVQSAALQLTGNDVKQERKSSTCCS